MDLATIIKGAVELGVIPVLALLLVLGLHQQNKHLRERLDEQDNRSWEMLKKLVEDIAEYKRQHPKERATHEDHH